MSDFNIQKGAFYLVVLVISTQMLIVISVAFFCAGGILFFNLPVGACKDLHDDISNIFNMAFTAAIAFAGGRYSAPTTSDFKVPEEKK